MLRNARQASGLFVALLALVAQLTLATAVPASSVSLADVTLLCQHGGAPDAPSKPPHQSPDCLLCFFCFGTTTAAGILIAPPALPRPTAVRLTSAVVLPPPTAPPPPVSLAAHPRGPPVPV